MYKLLIADDNAADREGIPTLCDWEGMGVAIAGVCADGEEALRAVSENPVDILLTDIVMPVMNGIELAERVRSLRPKTKIVFMSCYDEFEYAKSAVDLEINGYVLKPIMRADLREAMERALASLRRDEAVEAERQAMEAERRAVLQTLRESSPDVRDQLVKDLLVRKPDSTTPVVAGPAGGDAAGGDAGGGTAGGDSLFDRVQDQLAGRNESRGARVAESVKAIVRARYQDRVTVDDIAKAVYLSPRYLNGLFKRETGRTVFEYLLEYRMDAAKKLLMGGDCAVSDVADLVGYENKSHFALLFKRRVGVSPAKYRRRFAP